MRMMLYPEEHFWTVPTFHGLYDDNDYNGKNLLEWKKRKRKKKCKIKYHAIYGGKKFNSLCLTDIFCIRTFSFVKLFSEIDTFFSDINKKDKVKFTLFHHEYASAWFIIESINFHSKNLHSMKEMERNGRCWFFFSYDWHLKFKLKFNHRRTIRGRKHIKINHKVLLAWLWIRGTLTKFI